MKKTKTKPQITEDGAKADFTRAFAVTQSQCEKSKYITPLIVVAGLLLCYFADKEFFVKIPVVVAAGVLGGAYYFLSVWKRQKVKAVQARFEQSPDDVPAYARPFYITEIICATVDVVYVLIFTYMVRNFLISLFIDAEKISMAIFPVIAILMALIVSVATIKNSVVLMKKLHDDGKVE